MSIDEFQKAVAASAGLHDKITASHPSLRRGKVWCLSCGSSRDVKAAQALQSGWPKCCGYTMTIDSPEEREVRKR